MVRNGWNMKPGLPYGVAWASGLVSGKCLSWEGLWIWRHAAPPLAGLVIPQMEKMLCLTAHSNVSGYNFQPCLPVIPFSS